MTYRLLFSPPSRVGIGGGGIVPAPGLCSVFVVSTFTRYSDKEFRADRCTVSVCLCQCCQEYCDLSSCEGVTNALRILEVGLARNLRL